MNELISIIVPIYKVEKYLVECLESIINQSYKNFELILVDDGSPDKCPYICDQYKEKDERIIVIHKENGGVASAVNEGIKHSKGEYIFFVDSDDWIDLDMLEIMYNKSLEEVCDMVICSHQKVEDGVFKKADLHLIRNGRFNKTQIEKEIFPVLIHGQGIYEKAIYNSRCSKLFKRKLIIDNLKYFQTDVRKGEDALIMFSTVIDASSIYIMEDYYPYYYRMNEQSISHVFDEQLIEDFKNWHRGVSTIVKEKNKYDFSTQIDMLTVSSAYRLVLALRSRHKIDSKSSIKKQLRKLCDLPELKAIKNWKLSATLLNEKLYIYLIHKKKINAIILLNKVIINMRKIVKEKNV